MKRCRIKILQLGFLLVSVLASGATRNGIIRIKVLDSETRSISMGDNGVPKNCDAVNYDAYCHSSKTAEVTNTLLVQDGENPPFRVSCNVDTKWSRCALLLKGASFDAKREKRGLEIYYVDDQGKVRKQLYTYVGDETGKPAQPAAGIEKEAGATGTVKAGQEPSLSNGNPQAEVKCSFTSTPSGADITVDGRYVGSTPSVVSVSTGNHEVVVSLQGYAAWKRELRVSEGSELTVNAVLEKGQ